MTSKTSKTSKTYRDEIGNLVEAHSPEIAARRLYSSMMSPGAFHPEGLSLRGVIRTPFSKTYRVEFSTGTTCWMEEV